MGSCVIITSTENLRTLNLKSEDRAEEYTSTDTTRNKRCSEEQMILLSEEPRS